MGDSSKSIRDGEVATRWTAATEELVADAMGEAWMTHAIPWYSDWEIEEAISRGEMPEDFTNEAESRKADLKVARDILTALADAGLLAVSDA